MRSREGSLSPKKSLQKPPPLLLDDDDDNILLSPPPSTITQPEAQSAPLSPLVLPPAQPKQPQLPSPFYTESHFAKNCENQYFRYMPNSSTISHILLRRDNNQIAQFDIPCPHNAPGVPTIKPITNELYCFTLPNGEIAFQGKTDDEVMISRRSYNIYIQTPGDNAPVLHTFFPLSPKKDRATFYGPMPIKRFKNTDAAKKLMADTEIKIKQHAVDIVNADIPIRADMPRHPDQNTLMGMSAVTAFANFVKKYKHTITEELKELLEKSAQAPWRKPPDMSAKEFILWSQLRTEWLHAAGYRLTPLSENPQTSDNLGSARKLDNTWMMTAGEREIERIISEHYPDARARIDCTFTMLLDSEIINTIYFCAFVQIQNFHFNFINKKDALAKNPQFVKASDMASLVGLMCLMVQGVKPLLQSHVSILDHIPKVLRFSGNFFSSRHDSPDHKKRRKEGAVTTRDVGTSTDPEAQEEDIFARLCDVIAKEANDPIVLPQFRGQKI